MRYTVTKKDLVVTYFKDSGSGGQKKNKTSNCCRIKHPASGVMVQATESRSQAKNRATALRRLADHPDFLRWVMVKLAHPGDFLVEVQKRSPDGKLHWVPAMGDMSVTQEDINIHFSDL